MANRLEIIELTAKYAHRLDTRQIDLLMELWSDESPVFDEEDFGLGKATGKDEIRRHFEVDIYGQMENLCHLTTNHVINEISGSTASGTCTVFAQGDVRAGGTSRATAYYRDQYVHENGVWKFSSRKVIPLTRPKVGNFQFPDEAETADRVATP
ncbi:nuclear transport factor 2 family protein [Saccharothrix syringae]|uniref:Nuclear transport factor 2 family protein n=1 Tax=Saccharothrix syringae TaxID=103733 RepID=A0A5Q0HD76_SACSY|nr:nuclear transport factor 2 family protein [Saccharothrix syringae]